MTAPSPTEHKGLVKKMAGRVARRLKAAGARVIDADAIESELWLAWTMARNAFDPTRGVPFVAYFVRGAWTHINAWMRIQEREIANVGVSLDMPLGGSADGDTLGTVIADERAVPVIEELLRAEHRARVYARLERRAPLAAAALGILENPPRALYAEVEALRERARWAKSRGKFASPAPRSVTLSVILDVMGLDRTQRNTVYRELKALAGHL